MEVFDEKGVGWYIKGVVEPSVERSVRSTRGRRLGIAGTDPWRVLHHWRRYGECTQGRL